MIRICVSLRTNWKLKKKMRKIHGNRKNQKMKKKLLANVKNKIHLYTFQTCLELLNNILRDFYRKDHHAFHKISQIINECGGYTAIKQFANHSDDSISSMACELSRYSNGTCGECNQMTSVAMFETMQQ